MPPAAPGGLTVYFNLWRRKCLGFVNPRRAFRENFRSADYIKYDDYDLRTWIYFPD